MSTTIIVEVGSKCGFGFGPICGTSGTALRLGRVAILWAPAEFLGMIQGMHDSMIEATELLRELAAKRA